MAKRIALSGKPLAGKTTPAHYLRDHYEYTHASVSDYIISEYVKAMNAPWLVAERGELYTPGYVKQNKHTFRIALQQMGADLGLDNPDTVIATLSSVLRFAGAWHDLDQPVVLEAIRGELQASAARALGFVVVELHIDDKGQASRAETFEDYRNIRAAMQARPDIESGVDSASIRITPDLPLEAVAQLLATLPKEALSHGPADQPFTANSAADWGRIF